MMSRLVLELIRVTMTGHALSGKPPQSRPLAGILPEGQFKWRIAKCPQHYLLIDSF
jgi:hypothetical protein